MPRAQNNQICSNPQLIKCLYYLFAFFYRFGHFTCYFYFVLRFNTYGGSIVQRWYVGRGVVWSDLTLGAFCSSLWRFHCGMLGG